MEKIFLAKIKNDNDRDVVNYLEFNGFECNHYFGGLHICGACFGGFETELRKIVENNFEDLETILTKEEFMKLFELNDRIKALGYGIERGSDKYNEGIEIINEYENTIEKKLLSEENKQLFAKVVEEEKEYVMNEYNLSREEVEEAFDNYNGAYKDRAIISTVFKDFDDMVEEEKWSCGYDKQPYFDNEAFGNDLLESGYYYELPSGRIVAYAC